MGPEVLIALQAMRGAWAGIQYCCEALRDGNVEIQRIKKTVEGGVKDAQAIYKEVTGIWAWLQGLFGKKPQPPALATPAPTAAVEEQRPTKKKSKRDEYVEYVPNEDDIVRKFIDDLGTWFDNYGILKSFAEKRYAEVFGKDVINQRDVLELTQLQAELDAAYPTLRTLMGSAPWQLGPIWSKFQEMQDKVAAGQAARQAREKRERARREAAAAKARDDRIDRNVTIFFTALLIAYFWLLIGIVANV